MKATGTSSVAP